MPVDRELAYESLKKLDPKVYELYVKLKDGAITYEELKHTDAVSVYKLKLFVTVMDALDDLEQRGCITIFNDYKNRRVGFEKLRRLNTKYGVV